MEGVLGRSSKVLIDTQSSGNVLYLPLDQMTGNPGTPQRDLMPPVVAPQESQDPSEGSTTSRTPRREGKP
jgi:membrane protease subunit HflK